MMKKNSKIYNSHISKLERESKRKATKKMKQAYLSQKNNRELLLDVLSRVLLESNIVDNFVDISNVEKNKLMKKLSKTVNTGIKKELLIEKDKMREVLTEASIQKYGINSYVTSIGSDFKMKKLNPKKVSKIVNQKVKGKRWDERLWKNKNTLERKLRRDIKNLLDGKTDIKSIKDQIVRDYNQSSYNTKRLVDNEIARVQDSVNNEFAKENNIEKQMFMATLDDATTEECEALDSQVFNVDDPSKPSIPLHVNCRSVYVNIVEDWKPSRRRSKEQIGDWGSYEEWLNDQ